MGFTERTLHLALVSDCHLPIRENHSDMDRFLHLLDTMAEMSEQVVLLGDLFQVWAGIEPFDHPNGIRLLDRIAELGPERFFFVEGNWDFYIRRRYGGRFAQVVEDGLNLRAGESLFRLDHGHLHTGWKDRLWMGILKSGFAYHLFRTGWFNGFLRRLNRRFQEGIYRETLDTDRLRLLCNRLEERYQDVDRIICGHAHRLFQQNRVTVIPDYHSTGIFWGYDGKDHYYRLVGDGAGEVNPVELGLQPVEESEPLDL